MSEIYFTITGTNHWQGKEFIEPGMKVRLEKEPDNEEIAKRKDEIEKLYNEKFGGNA